MSACFRSPTVEDSTIPALLIVIMVAGHGVILICMVLGGIVGITVQVIFL